MRIFSRTKSRIRQELSYLKSLILVFIFLKGSVISLDERVAAVALENKLSFLNTVFGPEIYKVPIPKMVLNV
jgi:hypothetical protein